MFFKKKDEQEPIITSPVALASSFEPLKRHSSSRDEQRHETQAPAMKRSDHLLVEKPLAKEPSPLDVAAVAPYQAMPVHGPVSATGTITQNKASGLEVLGAKLTDEVRGCCRAPWCSHLAPSHMRAHATARCSDTRRPWHRAHRSGRRP